MSEFEITPLKVPETYDERCVRFSKLANNLREFSNGMDITLELVIQFVKEAINLNVGYAAYKDERILYDALILLESINPSKSKIVKSKKQREVLLACHEGRKHTYAERVIGPLCYKGFINVIEETTSGTAKKVELTETGKIAVRYIKENLERRLPNLKPLIRLGWDKF